MAALTPVEALEADITEEDSKLKKMKPHVPGIIIFADHNKPLPWSVTYHAVVMFADISGFTALCERYSTMGQSGVDQLTRTLNEYLSSLVDVILGADGDILKFAGDAILAIWRIGRMDEIQGEVIKVAKCCLEIQDNCGQWETDIDVKLTVKIGLSVGEMSITYLGNKEFRHYVELGPAVTAVNAAEHFCESGMVVASPDTWSYCNKTVFELEPLADGQHMRIVQVIPPKRTRSNSVPVHLIPSKLKPERRMSDGQSSGLSFLHQPDGSKNSMQNLTKSKPEAILEECEAREDGGAPSRLGSADRSRQGNEDYTTGRQIVDHTMRRGSADQAMRRENVDQTMRRESVDQAIRQESVDQAIRRESVDQAIRRESVDQAMRRENVDQTMRRENVDQAIRRESVDQAIRRESVDHTIRRESVDQAMRRESVDQAMRRESVDHTMRRESVDQTTRLGSGKLGMKGVVEDKLKIGAKFGKLRQIVTTVTEMKLDVALRLYILSPVLKKLDDKQPLTYLSEMRQVSIVFMNLVLSYDQDTTQLLQKVFQLIYDKTKAMHGSLNKVFLFDKGCTFLVIFGLPGFKHENDCAHALMCSGRMKSQLDRVEGVERVSVGVTTGTTFCGVVGHPKRHEYSVLGRKVNMAARLMMHYPGMVSCDLETFQTCRLPRAFFRLQETKAMKGLKNVGAIRQFVGFSKDEKTDAKPIVHSDYPLLGRHVEEFMFKEQLIGLQGVDNKRQHFVFNGPSGIGKSRLLDKFVIMAQRAGFKVISCQVELEDSSCPHFVSGHVLKGLLRHKGCTGGDFTKEPFLYHAIGSANANFIYVLNNVLGCQFEKPDCLLGVKLNESGKRRELMRYITAMCLDAGCKTVIVIDDAHNMDTSSWEFFCELQQVAHCLLVFTIRPSLLDAPTCRECFTFVEDFSVRLVDVASLDEKYMAPLACQMMHVMSIPYELDSLLRERAHGVPSWCMELLRDLLEKKQLLITLDSAVDETLFSVSPKTAQLVAMTTEDFGLQRSRRASSASMDGRRSSIDQQVESIQTKLLLKMGYLHCPLKSSTSQTVQGLNTAPLADGGNAYTRNLLKVPSDIVIKGSRMYHKRIAVFGKGVEPEQIPVPPAMKEMVTARIDSMRASDQLLVKCAAVLGTVVRRDILETLLPKAHRSKLPLAIRRLMESGIFQCSRQMSRPLLRAAKSHKSELVTQKYQCFCNPCDIQCSVGSIEVCFEPMFTNKLLQETAYETLMEAQRLELHTKAATSLELVADEKRNKVPYFMLCRPPDSDANELLKRIDMKMQDIDAVISRRANRIAHKQMSDVLYQRKAKEMKKKRGRRKALQVSAEETTPLVRKIVAGGTPMDDTIKLIESLLPLYDALVYHWTNANTSSGLLHTLVEAIAACVTTKKFDKASELMEMAMNKLENESIPPGMDEEYNMLSSKLYRLHGQIVYQSGEVLQAYQFMCKSAALLGLRVSERPHCSWFTRTKLLCQFMWYLKHPPHKRPSKDTCTLEQGYLLSDLYQMDKEQGFESSMLSHALQFFTKVAVNPFHIYQVLSAYAETIEVCYQKNWLDAVASLQAELLQLCAERTEEMTSTDRSVLGSIFAQSCLHYFNEGNLQAAHTFGSAACEISSCVRDIDTMRNCVPAFFFVCLYRNEYQRSIEVLQQLQYVSRMTNSDAMSLLFHALCLEIALVGGIPPIPAGDCLASLQVLLENSSNTTTEDVYQTYAASTMALWFTRMKRWSDMNEQLSQCSTIDPSAQQPFLYMLSWTNKLESRLLVLCHLLETKDKTAAASLEAEIKAELKKSFKFSKKVPLLVPRLKLLQAYLWAMNGQETRAKSGLKNLTATCRKLGHLLEEQRVVDNIHSWCTNKDCGRNNVAWMEHVQDESKDVDDVCDCSDLVQFTLPLPVR